MTLPCNLCYKISPADNLRCGKCKAVYYCSRDCQKQDWKDHKDLCKAGRRKWQGEGVESDSSDLDVLTRNPNYAKEYAKRHPLKRTHVRQLEKQRELCSQFDLISGMISLREHEQICEDFMFFKRFQAPRRWTVEEAQTMLKKHKEGELKIGQMLQPVVERNMSSETIKDHPPASLIYLSGKTYVAVGFVDLSQLLLGEVVDDADNPDPVKFVGIDCGSIQINRAKLIYEMLKDDEVCARDVLQVWFSTQLDRSAKKSLLKVGKRLEREVVADWANNSFKIADSLQVSEGQEDWGSPLENDLLPLNTFCRDFDRIDYAEYVFSGKVFVQDSSSPAICGNPTKLTGSSARESIFDICELDMFKSCQDEGVHLFQALDRYFMSRMERLKELVSKERIVCQFHRQRITLRQDDPAALMIKELDPVSIDWSNVADYFDPSDFRSFASKCSSPKTVHTLHSAGWTNLCYGSSIVDYAFSKDFDLDQMLETAKYFIEAYWKLELKKRPQLTSFLNEKCGVRFFTIDAIDAVLATVFRRFFVAHFYSCKSLTMDTRLHLNGISRRSSVSAAVDFAFAVAPNADFANVIANAERDFKTMKIKDS